MGFRFSGLSWCLGGLASGVCRTGTQMIHDNPKSSGQEHGN